MSDTTLPTQDERVMAALSHGAILIPTYGIVVPIIVWLTQKEKSRYVAFQALQAVAFHVAEIILVTLVMGCYMLAFVVPLFTAVALGFGDNFGTTGPSAGGFFLPFLVFPLFFIVIIFFAVYGLIGAIQTLQGKNFRYLLIGRLLENWLAR